MSTTEVKECILLTKNFFHRSANIGFDTTKAVLVELLSKAETFTNDSLKQIVDGFIASCEEDGVYPWRYYYVKYKVFRPGSYGKYSNSHFDEKPYMFSVMQTKSQWSSNTYMPYLKEADDAHLDKDSMGQRLVYGDKHIICDNAAYLFRDNETEEVVETIEIKQNEAGVDTEDRILLLKNYLAEKKL